MKESRSCQRILLDSWKGLHYPLGVKKELQAITSDFHLEARWLNTLSLLEFIGSRKIAKAVCDAHPSLEILEHLADEARHAHLFKKLSILLDPSGDENYLCGDEAVSYFQMLDTSVSEWVKKLTEKENSYTNYLFVTCMIERRAMKLYPLYKSLIPNGEVAAGLQQIILEESHHLHDIESKARKILSQFGQEGFTECLEIEENLFEVFLASLRRELNIAPREVHQAA